MLRIPLLCFLLTVFSLTTKASSSAGQGPLSVDQIMNLAVNKIAEDNKVKAEKLTYRKKYIEENVEYKGNKIVPKKTVKEELYQVYSANGMWYEQLITRNGKPPKSNDGQPRLADVRPVMEDILGKSRYNYTLNGLVHFNEVDVYSISFEPRHPSLQPGPEPDASLEEEISNQIINNLSGTIYVDTGDYAIPRVEAHITKTKTPLRMKAVGIAYMFDVTLEQQKFKDNGIIDIGVGKRVEIIGKGAKFNIKILELGGQFKKVTIEYSNYELK